MKEILAQEIKSLRNSSLPDQRDLEVGGAVLFRIEAAAVDLARPPEQQVAFEVDEIVLHEVRPFFQGEGSEALSEYALRRVDRPRSVSSRRDLIEHIGKPLREGSYLVALVGNEVHFL